MLEVLDREPIYAALFARLSGISSLKTKSRRLRHWTDVPSEEQPALFQAQVREVITPRTGMPSRVKFDVDLYLYVNVLADQDQSPSEVFNPILDDIAKALASESPSGKQTLGGIVHSVRISGTIETDEGTLGQQAVLIIPVEVLVTD
jgi:hypothetical protein